MIESLKKITALSARLFESVGQRSSDVSLIRPVPCKSIALSTYEASSSGDEVIRPIYKSSPVVRHSVYFRVISERKFPKNPSGCGSQARREVGEARFLFSVGVEKRGTLRSPSSSSSRWHDKKSDARPLAVLNSNYWLPPTPDTPSAPPVAVTSPPSSAAWAEKTWKKKNPISLPRQPRRRRRPAACVDFDKDPPREAGGPPAFLHFFSQPSSSSFSFATPSKLYSSAPALYRGERGRRQTRPDSNGGMEIFRYWLAVINDPTRFKSSMRP